MKKILLPISVLMTLAIAVGGSLSGCTDEKKYSDSIDTTIINPVIKSDSDTTANVMSVTGKVTDGAMNSVFIEISPDSAQEFAYPQLDRNNSEVFYNWSIDDNITIKYVKTTRNGEEIDSVISIQKAD